MMASRSPLTSGVRSSASRIAVPIVGWPAKGSSRPGVKMRTRAECAGFSGFRTNTVSDRLSSRAIACICSAVEPVGIVDDGERIAAETAVGEHVERVEGQRHAGDGP